MVKLFILSVFISSSIAAKGQGIPPATAKRLLELPGTYIGKLPCADCSGIQTSLTLQCDSLCHGGRYMIIDKYLGTKNGDQTNKRKGNWQIVQKGMAGQGDIIIALDVDDTAKTSFYMMKKDGDLLPLDKDQHKTDGPFGLTLKKL